MNRSELKKEAKESLRGRWGIAIGIIALYMVVSLAISMIAAYIPGIGGIASIVITVPLAYGFVGQIIKFSRREEVGYFDFFTIGFKNFSRTFSIFGNTLLKILPFLIIYIIASVLFAVALVFVAAFSLSGTIASVTLVSPELQSEITNYFSGFATGIGILVIILIVLAIIWLIAVIALAVRYYLYTLANYIGNDNPEMTGKEAVEKSAELMKGHRWEYFVLSLSFLGWAILASFTWGIGYLWLVPYIQVTTVKFYEHVAGINKENTTDNDIVEIQ